MFFTMDCPIYIYRNEIFYQTISTYIHGYEQLYNEDNSKIFICIVVFKYIVLIQTSFHNLRKFESGNKSIPSFLESNGVFFLISSYLILLIKVSVNKSYLPLKLEHIRLLLYYIKKYILASKVHN